MICRNPIASWRLWPVIASVALLLLTFDLCAWLAGEAPRVALARALVGTWGTAYGIGQVLYKATPLLFSGLAFDIAFRARLFNIGVEGQMAVASLAAGLCAAALPAATPAVFALSVVILVAMTTGALWASLAGALRAFWGAHEVITTIMQNRIADALIALCLAQGAKRLGNAFRTADAIAGARLPRLEHLVSRFHGSAASTALFLALGVPFAVHAFQSRSRLGREITWVGLNPEACQAAGIPTARRLLYAMMLSGSAAGLIATATVLGYKGYYETGLGSGVGFAGIAVALLGRGHPLGLIASALLFGTLQQAGLVLNATVPKEVMDILFGLCILLVALSLSFRGSTRRPAPKKRGFLGSPPHAGSPACSEGIRCWWPIARQTPKAEEPRGVAGTQSERP